MSSPEKPPPAEPSETEADFIALSPSERTWDPVPPDQDAQSTTDTSILHQQHPPLPAEQPPPLPDEAPPTTSVKDDGWEPVWDASAQAFYFYNRFTQAIQWENPRVPSETQTDEKDGDTGELSTQTDSKVAGGYNPAIHGDYDPNADYAQRDGAAARADGDAATTAADPAQVYAATGAFNRFTGKWQRAELNPDNFNDDNKSQRQMKAFFDVDAAANVHDGRSLKAERSNKKLSKKELKAFKEKRREKKEEKRRAWLRD